MDTELIRRGPFTVDRNDAAVEFGLALEWDPHEGLYRWLASADRWHYLPIAREALVAVDAEHHEATDDEGTRWVFRPVAQADTSLVALSVPEPPADFPGWVAAQLADDIEAVAAGRRRHDLCAR